MLLAIFFSLMCVFCNKFTVAENTNVLAQHKLFILVLLHGKFPLGQDFLKGHSQVVDWGLHTKGV